jgi:hypothetical protein
MQKVVEKPRKSCPPQIQSEIVDVTPGMAQAWLDKNISNRKPRPAVVAAYMRAMLDDSWNLTGDAIRFDQAGNLMDGQHRLMACVQADVSFKTFVLYNVPEEARDTIDTNIVRTVTDTLTMEGTRFATITPAVVRWLVQAKRGNGIARDTNSAQRLKLTTQEVKTVLRDHPMLITCIGRVMNRSPRIKGTTAAGLAWVLYASETYLDAPSLGQAFLEVFSTGIPSREGCPAHAFRERALRMAHSREKMATEMMQAGLIHAWNLFASGEQRPGHFRIPNTPVWIAGLDRKKIK